MQAIPNIIITKRDIEVFKYLFFNKIASNEQLRIDIFDNNSKQSVHRRLDKLIKNGFLEATYLREKGNRIIYNLSKKAFQRYIATPKEL